MAATWLSQFFPCLCHPPQTTCHPSTDTADLVSFGIQHPRPGAWPDGVSPAHALANRHAGPGLDPAVAVKLLQCVLDTHIVLDSLRQSPTDKSAFVEICVSSGAFSAHLWSSN